MIKNKLLFLVFCFLFLSFNLNVEAIPARINIATATTGGSYYPIGIAWAQLFNENIDGMQASASTSAGSVENIDILRNREAQLAFSQDNVILWAYEGSENFIGNPFPELRIVIPVLTSPHHIVIRKDANINSIVDLKGKRFVVGRPGSGNETTAKAILDVFDMTFDDIIPEYIGQNEAIDALKNRQVDAALVVGGSPMSVIVEYLMTHERQGTILAFSEEEIKKLSGKYSWMQPMTIPGGSYPGIDYDIRVTGNIASAITTTELLDEQTVYEMLKVIYENEEWLKENIHTLNNEAFESPWNYFGLIPLHPGSEKYFKEIGKIKQ